MTSELYCDIISYIFLFDICATAGIFDRTNCSRMTNQSYFLSLHDERNFIHYYFALKRVRDPLVVAVTAAHI